VAIDEFFCRAGSLLGRSLYDALEIDRTVPQVTPRSPPRWMAISARSSKKRLEKKTLPAGEAQERWVVWLRGQDASVTCRT
jgi:hypothetical protein